MSPRLSQGNSGCSFYLAFGRRSFIFSSIIPLQLLIITFKNNIQKGFIAIPNINYKLYPCPFCIDQSFPNYWMGSTIQQNIFIRLYNQMSSVAPRKKRITKNYLRIIGNPDLYYKNQVLIDFKPLKKKKGILHSSILPTFTNDKKYFTSSFTLPSDKMESDEQMLLDHQRRVKQVCCQFDQIYMPKPRSKSKYCGVCRGHYQDYKEHIQSQGHMNKLYHSNYQTLINKMCIEFRNEINPFMGKNVEPVTMEEMEQKSIDSILLRTATKVNQ